MNDQSSGIPFFDWIGRYLNVLVPSTLVIISGLIAIFHRYKMSIATELKDSKASMETELKNSEHNVDLEIAKVWAEVRNVLAMQATHVSKIAVLEVEQRNTWTRLDEIKHMVHDTNQKIDAMYKEVIRWTK